MFVLYHLVEPMVKLYLVDGNHFSTYKIEAHPFETRDEAMKESGNYPFDLQIEPMDEQ